MVFAQATCCYFTFNKNITGIETTYFPGFVLKRQNLPTLRHEAYWRNRCAATFVLNLGTKSSIRMKMNMEHW